MVLSKIALLLCMMFLLGACAGAAGKTGAAPAAVSRDQEVEDVRRIPQHLGALAAAAGDGLALEGSCRDALLEEFRRNFFLPWTSDSYLGNPEEMRSFMRQQAKGRWFLVNKRRIRSSEMQELLENCALDSFPSRDDLGIAVAPGHLRGLPTSMPFFERANSMPFDMLSYPQVKLNEPLRVLHASRDGVWLFVETVYSNGWLEARDVAFVDRDLARSWMRGPHLTITEDYAAIPNGRGNASYRAKIGTILPLAGRSDDAWEVKVASAGEGGKAELRGVLIPRKAASPFPLDFDKATVAMVGDQLLGRPYGWGEQHDLRDCSALLRDLFLPFGIWLPRTATDQIGSLPGRRDLARLSPREKEELIRTEGVPFRTLIFKPGHIMLYVGLDPEGRPLLFHDAWSVRVKDGEKERTHMIGLSVITTLEPGKELGLVPGTSLLDKVTEMGTLRERCGRKAD